MKLQLTLRCIITNVSYQHKNGSLTHVLTATHPEIPAAANTMSKFMQKPKKLVFDSFVLSVYSDSNWASAVNTNYSTSGYLFQVYGNTIGMDHAAF